MNRVWCRVSKWPPRVLYTIVIILRLNRVVVGLCLLSMGGRDTRRLFMLKIRLWCLGLLIICVMRRCGLVLRSRRLGLDL